MGKRRMSAGAQIINLWEQLNESERVLVYDVIRSAQPKKAAKGGKKSSRDPLAARLPLGADKDGVLRYAGDDAVDATLNS